MKILHTSDWHVGRTFHGVDLLPDQQRALAAIADIVARRGVDVVVVPGDVYDRAVPSADAVRVCNAGFEAIRAAGAQIVATSGNHDSPARLGAGAAFSAAGGLHLFTTVAGLARPVVIDDQFGPVAFYGIPYLEPETTRAELDVPQARSHSDILAAAMDRVRADLAERTTGTRAVVLAHAFVVGAVCSGSERSIAVGGVETVPASSFDGVHYTALGHLHSPQVVSDTVRYSGSPLPYSFGERTHRKAVWLVDLDAHGVAEIERVDLPVVRPLTQLEGSLDSLLCDARFAFATDHYVSAVLTDEVRPVDGMRRLQQRFPHAVHLELRRPPRVGERSYRDAVRGRTDAEIMLSFVADLRSAPTDGEVALLGRALTAVTRERTGSDGVDRTGEASEHLEERSA